MKSITWTCRGGECGGYADRLKGIVTARLLADRLNRDFFVEWDGPARLADWFDFPVSPTVAPRHLRRIDYLSTRQSVDELLSELDGAAGDLAVSINQYDEPHWDVLTDHADTIGGTFKRVLDSVLCPRPEIKFHPQFLRVQDKMNGKAVVGVQVRTGFSSYPRDAAVTVPNMEDVLAAVERSGCPLAFIASDSPSWKRAFMDVCSTEAAFIDVAPAHTEKSTTAEIVETFPLTVIEHRLLSSCRQVITGQGGFGKTAAWWGGIQCVDLLRECAA